MARLRGCKRAHSAPIRDPLASFVQLHNMEMTSACQRRGRAVNPMVDRAAERPYRLLIEAMTDLQKVAVGKIVLRAKEHLVAIRDRAGHSRWRCSSCLERVCIGRRSHK